MKDNPIVAEVDRIREQLLAECGGDFDAFVTEMQRRTAEAARTGQEVVSLPPRRPKEWT